MKRQWFAIVAGASVFLSANIAHGAVNPNGVGIVTSNLLFYLNAGHPDSYVSGTSWQDLSGNGLHATARNTITHTRASSGSYFGFSGGPAEVYTATGASPFFSLGNTNFDFSNGFSVSFYASFGTSADTWERIFDFGNKNEGSNFLLGRPGNNSYIFYESWNLNATKGTCTGPAAGDGSIVTQNPMVLQFYTLTISANSGPIPGVCKWYRNGNSISSTQNLLNGNNNLLPVNVSRTNNWIGRSNWEDSYLEGRIYSIAMYNKVLSDSEVQQNFTSMTDIEWPTVGGGGNLSLNENLLNVTSITSNESGSNYSIVGGSDSSKFAVNAATGALTFRNAPNYENPDDFGGNRTYDVTIRVIEPDGNYQDLAVSVRTDDVVEGSTLSLPSLAGIPYKGLSLNISVTPTGDGTSIPGKVSFFMAGKRIAGCYKKVFSGTGSVVCSWKPATMGNREISVSFTPTNAAFLPSSTKKTFWIYKRTTNR